VIDNPYPRFTASPYCPGILKDNIVLIIVRNKETTVGNGIQLRGSCAIQLLLIKKKGPKKHTLKSSISEIGSHSSAFLKIQSVITCILSGFNSEMGTSIASPYIGGY
jgi:hypothetical protein